MNSETLKIYRYISENFPQIFTILTMGGLLYVVRPLLGDNEMDILLIVWLWLILVLLVLPGRKS